ncbi:hypothetical protein EPI10_011168 [Gossypium australe]|uniref:Uncharacterized protein n=1 Tax=Gossypium australe TaxID=47621 RepID=A0A5B6W5V9_9ROSI|nr:hypothetical protein EPI10_011168 [Gossypium australe]
MSNSQEEPKSTESSKASSLPPPSNPRNPQLAMVPLEAPGIEASIQTTIADSINESCCVTMMFIRGHDKIKTKSCIMEPPTLRHQPKNLKFLQFGPFSTSD